MRDTLGRAEGAGSVFYTVLELQDQGGNPPAQLCAEALDRSSGVVTGAGFEGREEREGISGRDSTERMLERSQLTPWVQSSLPAQHKAKEPLPGLNPSCERDRAEESQPEHCRRGELTLPRTLQGQEGSHLTPQLHPPTEP